MGQIGGITAAQLQGQRMLLGIEAQMTLNAAMADCTGGDHLGVKHGVLRQKAMEKPAMPIGPVHHGRNRQAPRAKVVKECLIHTPIIINK
jgi:hypothetical protein